MTTPEIVDLELRQYQHETATLDDPQSGARSTAVQPANGRRRDRPLDRSARDDLPLRRGGPGQRMGGAAAAQCAGL